MKGERTSVGLDVHARSVACGIDDDTGEMFRARLSPQFEVIPAWLRQLPGPVAVTYEAPRGNVGDHDVGVHPRTSEAVRGCPGRLWAVTGDRTPPRHTSPYRPRPSRTAEPAPGGGLLRSACRQRASLADNGSSTSPQARVAAADP